MTELRELYQEVILDHNKKPRNFRRPEGTNREAEGNNPLCGDQMTVFVDLEGDTIADIGFQGQGCAISRASASMMTVSLKGKTTADAEAMFQNVHEMLTGSDDAEANAEELGSLRVLSGVRQYPSRIKCASLCWHALRSALRGDTRMVSTE